MNSSLGIETSEPKKSEKNARAGKRAAA